MRYFLIVCFFSIYFKNLSAQENHFVFIQSENNQPFYVSLKGKLYSSAAAGYLILPKLSNGNYDFSVGFAKNAFPEQDFHCVIDNKDLGFNLKNFGEKGWSLIDLQSQNVLTGESSSADNISRALREKDVKEDADPVISFNKKKDITEKELEVAQSSDTLTSQPTAKDEKQNGEVAKSNDPQTESKQDEAVMGGDVITKVSEDKVEDGVHLAFLDGDHSKGDTINITIPSDKTSVSTESNNSSPQTDVARQPDTSTPLPGAEESGATKSDSLKFLDINTEKPKKETTDNTSQARSNTSLITNSKCKDVATEDDYTRLRRKMAGETSDEKMIAAARKIYRNKCFTTNQVKRLSTLFLSDEGRYNFFNASYNSVSDVAEYSSLQTEFIDPAFIDRFKAMLK